MRPGIGLDNVDSRPRKSSVGDPPSITGDRSSHGPTTFFLSRESDITRSSLERNVDSSTSTVSLSPVTSLQDMIQEADRPYKHPTPRSAEGRSGSRRRSTIKPGTCTGLRRGSSSTSNDPNIPLPDGGITPSPLHSREISLPSSPKSVSSRSLQKSDDGSINDDTGSQAIASSEEDEGEMSTKVQDSQPELIMPSIKMPSRRPFTERGKGLGRFKVMVAGRQASGKTSLIKSIVQLCEDIVHVDPLSPSSSLHTSQRESHLRHTAVSEIYASTKPYPGWWSNVEESRILRRRKSMGDSVLERNVCFVDTSDSMKLEKIISYIEQQLVNALSSVDQLSGEFSGMLSGRGSSQVDVILYLLRQDDIKGDCQRIQQLSELCNVIPLVAKSDLLSPDDIQQIKQTVDLAITALPRLPASLSSEFYEQKAQATAPYTVTSINGPDLDTMDASLLMSPEYVQPLLPSELRLLVEQIFELDTVAYLRHMSARKLVAWHASHPRLTTIPSPSLPSVHNSTLASPIQTSLSNSGLLIPLGSEVSLNTSNSWALAKVADHTQREERIAQVRLSKWASELQLSLQRERERYERLARNERAVWLVERMGEEVRDGKFHVPETEQALVHKGSRASMAYGDVPNYQMHDPLGILRWQDSMRTRGWIAFQVVGSFGVVGGLAFWLAKTWGLTASLNDWAQELHGSWFGNE